MNTDELIQQLSSDAPPKKPLAKPFPLWSTAMGGSVVYIVLLLALLGVRPDIHAYLMQPGSMIELWLLFVLLAVSLWSAICYVYPDQYGQSFVMPLPYAIFAALMLLLASQIEQIDTAAFINNMPQHIICMSCLAAASIVPSFLLFLLTQRGATSSPIRSGIYIMFAAISIGCIALRLHEPTQDMAHIFLSHYAPLVVFAGLGALLGHLTVRW